MLNPWTIFVLPLQNLTHLLVFLELVLMTIVTQCTTPTIKVVIYQVIIGF